MPAKGLFKRSGKNIADPSFAVFGEVRIEGRLRFGVFFTQLRGLIFGLREDRTLRFLGGATGFLKAQIDDFLPFGADARERRALRLQSVACLFPGCFVDFNDF